MLQTYDKWLSHATNQHLQTTYSSLKPTILEKTGFLRKTRFFFIHLELAGFASSTRKKEGSGSSRYVYYMYMFYSCLGKIPILANTFGRLSTTFNPM